MKTNTAGENQKRILVVEGHPQYFVSHRLPWARAAREAGYEIHVTALKTGDGDRVREEGFRYHELAEQDRSKNPATELRFLCRLYHLLCALAWLFVFGGDGVGAGAAMGHHALPHLCASPPQSDHHVPEPRRREDLRVSRRRSQRAHGRHARVGR
ncbi:MAG: hypothetical protein BRD43_03605 [Bacteroidetes bacterium QS_4_64_154]|nr:MAG: hypothetical protein BRD43_03605 [Bacteroidetes bacterium QS_4_64_154]